MGKVVKGILIASLALIAGGTALSGVAYGLGARPMSMAWDGSSPSYDERISLDAYRNMNLDLSFYELNIERVSGDDWSVGIDKGQNVVGPELEVRDGTLYVTDKMRVGNNGSSWFFGFHLPDFKLQYSKPAIVLYVPQTASFGTLDLKGGATSLAISGVDIEQVQATVDLGSFSMDNNATLKNAKISSSAGEIELSRLKADRLDLTSNLGTVELADVEADEVFVSADLGTVEFSDCRFGKAELDSNMGDITLENVESGGLLADAQAGSIEVEGALRGKTVLTSNLGSIDVESTLPRSEYTLELDSNLGSIDVEGKGSWRSSTGPNLLRLSSDMGGIEVRFRGDGDYDREYEGDWDDWDD